MVPKMELLADIIEKSFIKFRVPKKPEGIPIRLENLVFEHEKAIFEEIF